MKYSERMLQKILEALVPGVKKILKILDSKQPDSEKVFQIRVAIWNAESDVQKELQVFIEHQLFSTVNEHKKLPPNCKSLGLKKHEVYNIYFLN